MDFPTFDDLFNIARDEILSLNTKLSREAVEREGMDANAMVAAAAAVGDEVIGQLLGVSSGLYSTATGTKLEKLYFDRYQLTKKSAAPAIGTVTFSLPTPAVAPFTIPIGTTVQTSDGIIFITTESGLFLAGQTSLVVAIRSASAGASQSAGKGAITSITGKIDSAPSGLIVSNPYATAGASDAESEADFRDRGVQFWINARRGTAGAIEQAALKLPGITKASAVEYLDALGRPARSIQLIVSDSFTDQFVDYTTTPPRYAAQSRQITQDVFNGLYDARAYGINIQIYMASVQLVSVLLQLSFSSGANVDLTATLARAAIVNYINGLKPGESFSRYNAGQVLQRIPGLIWTGQEIQSPQGDIIPTPLIVLRAGLSLVSASATQSDRPLIFSLNPDAYP